MSIFFNFIKCFAAITFIVSNSLLLAQSHEKTDALWSDLADQTQKGSLQALRDLGTFLDKPNYALATRHTLMAYTFFTNNEINLSKATREEFLTFFYEQRDAIKYSEILHGFYRTPIEEQPLDATLFDVINHRNSLTSNTSIKFYDLSQKFDSLLSHKGRISDIQSVIEQISVLKTLEAYNWLRHTLASESFKGNYSDVYRMLCYGLKTDPSEETLNAILNAADKKLVQPDEMPSVFVELTNGIVSAAQTRLLLDTLGSLAAIRAYGYEQCLPFKESFFYEKVDYLGKILSSPHASHWACCNALLDLLATNHPRSLFFLAAQVRLKPHEKEDYTKLLEKLTNTELIVKKVDNSKGDNELAEIQKWKNYVHWWAVHHEDFEWDNTTKRFLSRSELTARTEEIERLIRRLGSTNDSVAIASFRQLTENDPPTVISLMEKFRPLLRTYNARLPEINYPFLENMTLLMSYCSNHKIRITFSPVMDSLWSKLLIANDPSKRYELENKLIKRLSLNDITALEYQGLLYASDLELSFSVSRILDIFYSTHWAQIISDDAALRLYLKKSALFQHIGTNGTSNLYNRKMEKTNTVLYQALDKIVRTESDVDIRREILAWLAPPMVIRNEDMTEVKVPEKKIETLEEKIEQLKSAPEILIEEINAFVAHPHFSERYKPLLIQFLKKTTPLSSVRQFKLKNDFLTTADLASFADMTIAAKDLDDFVGIFKMNQDANKAHTEGVMWAFINDKIKNYSIDEQGSFWNAMFKIAWFNNLIYAGTMLTVQKDTVLSTMRNYLINSELLSEFEEQTTQIHIVSLENIGRSLTDKLASTLQLDANVTIKKAVQSAILARVSYEDIGIVASFAEKTSPTLFAELPLHFLQTDFGLPIFCFDQENLKQLAENHKKMSPKAFYTFYLKQFGVNIWHTEGVLDYEKIYKILQHESVLAFTGGGTQRDYFTFGVIKLLEFEFGTCLGFHLKLNENQTFYTYNTSKRAAAWRQFLIEKNLFKLSPLASPSFKF